MLGRDIEIIKEEKLPRKPKIKVFYLSELSYNGVVNKNNPRPPSVPAIGMPRIRVKGWKGYLIDYLNSSSFHGLNHLAAPNRHFTERIFTVILIICALIALILLSMNFWHQYQTDSTVILLDHDYYNYKIIQASPVVCPRVGVNVSKFPEVFKKYGVEDTEEMRQFFTEISRKPYMYDKKQPVTVNVPSKHWLAILNDLKNNIIYDQYETAKEMQWIITNYGFCQQIHSYTSQYSTFEYYQSSNLTVIPIPENNLRLCTYLDTNCQTSLQIKNSDIFFGVAHPHDIIDFTRNKYESAGSSREVHLSVNEITSSEDLKMLSIKQRDCVFSDEISLTMWPIYTLAMCKRECIYRRMYEICGCYHHFARPTPGIPICNLEQLRCVANNSKKIIVINRKRAEKCGCYDDCHYARYAVELVRSIPLTFGGGPQFSSINIIMIFPIDKYKREVIFGFIDFLAAVGGAAGLLLGASLLSFVELFYFGTLRLYWHRVKMQLQSKKTKKNKRKAF